jgi:hypothetical protein
MNQHVGANFSDLQGKILVGVNVLDDLISFITYCGNRYEMYHNQDCCEDVHIESVVGDLEDICGQRIEVAEERISTNENPDDEYDSSTWSFYTLRTVKGSVDIRWVGTSNGYYSETVSFYKIV